MTGHDLYDLLLAMERGVAISQYIDIHIDKGTAHLQITNLECDKFGCIEL